MPGAQKGDPEFNKFAIGYPLWSVYVSYLRHNHQTNKTIPVNNNYCYRSLHIQNPSLCNSYHSPNSTFDQTKHFDQQQPPSPSPLYLLYRSVHHIFLIIFIVIVKAFSALLTVTKFVTVCINNVTSISCFQNPPTKQRQVCN
jgi:hypothetical protein